MIHDVKISWMYFDDVLSGNKPFELRWDDRGYAVGDTLLLREVRDGVCTGRSCQKMITFKLEKFEGLVPGWCILGLGGDGVSV